MQPPSEADVVAATESLIQRRNVKTQLIDALELLQARLLECHTQDMDPGIAHAVCNCLSAWSSEQCLDRDVLGSQIAFNQRALAAYRSNIVLPSFGPRKPSN